MCRRPVHRLPVVLQECDVPANTPRQTLSSNLLNCDFTGAHGRTRQWHGALETALTATSNLVGTASTGARADSLQNKKSRKLKVAEPTLPHARTAEGVVKAASLNDMR